MCTLNKILNYLLNKTGPPGLSPAVLLTTVRVLVEQFESFSSDGETIGVSSFISAPSGSFSVTGVLTGLFNGDSRQRVNLLIRLSYEKIIIIKR